MNVRSICNAAVAAGFLAFIGAWGVVFALRIGFRELGPEEARRTPFSSSVLAGGSPEIGGTPPRPRSFRNRIEWELAHNFPLRVPILEAAAFCEALSLWNVPTLSPDVVPYRIEDDFWGHSYYRKRKELRQDCYRTRKLIGFLSRLGLGTLFVAPPVRVASDDVLSRNVFDFSAGQTAKIVRELEKDGTPCLDLSKLLEEDGIDPHDAFFSSDHHFNASTARWAAKRIASHLEKIGLASGFDFRAMSADRFRTETLPDFFLGSIGRRATMSVCPPEDFDLLHFLSHGHFTIDVQDEEGRKTSETGTFEVLMDRDALAGDFPSYDQSSYEVFLRGDSPCTTIRNHGHPNGPRILVFGDSFDNAMSIFLACGSSLVTTVDNRRGRIPIDRLIGGQKYDAAVVLYQSRPPRGVLKSLESGIRDSAPAKGTSQN